MSRQIVSTIENYIDARVGPKLIVPYADTKPQKLFLMALDAMVGLHEQGGNNCGKMVEAIQHTVGKAEKEPWCMGLIQTAVAYAEKKTNRRCSLPVSEGCTATFEAAEKLNLTVKDPIVGDLIIWKYGDTWKGHVGCIIEDGDQFVRTIEGNTSPEEKGINREGDGVYHKLRSLKGAGAMKVLGFIRLSF